jgi:branched-subunit amino acid aminotransferase/4-amino-4-deoxychorismate lyase
MPTSPAVQMINENKLTHGTSDGQGRARIDHPADRVWLNGQVHEVAGPLDAVRRAIRYGDGIFATLRIDAGRLLDAERHAARLLSGAEAIGLEPPPGFLDERQIIERLLAASGDLGTDPGTDGVLRCQWSATGGGRGFGRSSDSIALVELSQLPPVRRLTVRVLDSDAVPRPSIAHIKSCSALPHVIAARLAARLGVEEVIRVYDGWLAEGISANLFFERQGRLFTPEPGLPLYPGTVRRRVIEQAGALGVEVVEGRWKADELRACDGAFLTGSVRGVECVLRLDECVLKPTPLIDAVSRATAEARRADAVQLPGASR